MFSLMKKTLTTFAASAVFCTLSQAETTYTSTDAHRGGAYDQFIYGLITTLDVPPGKTYIRTSGELPATVCLQSVSFGSAAGANPATSSYKLADYQLASAYYRLGSPLLALSQAAGFSSVDGSISFIFDDVVVETNPDLCYMFLFVGADMTEEMLSAHAGEDIFSFIRDYGMFPWLEMSRLDPYETDNETLSFLYDSELQTTYTTDFVLPSYTITMTGQSAVIPEPATAALGLLAISSVASRRMRAVCRSQDRIFYNGREISFQFLFCITMHLGCNALHINYLQG